MGIPPGWWPYNVAAYSFFQSPCWPLFSPVWHLNILAAVRCIGSLKDLKQVTIDVVATNFNRVIISIMDTGEGFDLNVIDKLCLPFTTTKEIGLGLGLNISLSLMKQMKGDLFLGSTVTGGAMVILEFTSAPFLNVKKELIDDIE